MKIDDNLKDNNHISLAFSKTKHQFILSIIKNILIKSINLFIYLKYFSYFYFKINIIHNLILTTYFLKV